MTEKEIIIVEQGRVSWKNEYQTVTYAPVDSTETGEFLAQEILKDYRKRYNAKTKKVAKDIYEIRIKHEMLQDEVYLISIRRFKPQSIERVKEALQELKNKKPSCPVSYDLN